MAKSPFDIFGTEPSLETLGVNIDFGSFYFKVARAGGANTSFREVIRSKLQPYQRAIELGEMDEKVADKLTAEAFAETVMLGWGSTEFGEGKIPGKDGKPIAYSVEAAKKLLTDLPELMKDLMAQAQKLSNFRAAAADADAKN
jgi:hypothetical protein